MTGNQQFANWLSLLLFERNMTQAELARQIGATRQTISNVINVQKGPGNSLLTAISRAFDIPPEEVFRAAGILPDADSVEDKMLETINFKLSSLPDNEREEILRFIDFKLEEKRHHGKEKAGNARLVEQPKT